MSRNGPVIHTVIIELLAPWGPETLHFPSDPDVERYTANPDAFAAAYSGLSEADYFEWLDVHGKPLCGHPTKSGKPCRNQVGHMLSEASAWKARHRLEYCAAHGGAEAS